MSNELRAIYEQGVRDGVSKQRAASNDTRPDWNGKCENCGAPPIVPFTGLCGPCTFGEADTVNGNW